MAKHPKRAKSRHPEKPVRFDNSDRGEAWNGARHENSGGSTRMENLPEGMSFYPDKHLFINRLGRHIDESSFRIALRTVSEIETWYHEPFNRFVDASRVQSVDVTVRYIVLQALYRRHVYRDRPHVKSALLTFNKDLIHLSMLQTALFKGANITLRIVKNRAEAAKWLRVPVELLN